MQQPATSHRFTDNALGLLCVGSCRDLSGQRSEIRYNLQLARIWRKCLLQNRAVALDAAAAATVITPYLIKLVS